MVQADHIQLLQQLESVLPFPVKLGEPWIGPEYFVPAGVKPEVHRATVEMGLQLVNLILALLPAGGNGGDSTVYTVCAEVLGDRRAMPLRS
jgi:hypothetical protein